MVRSGAMKQAAVLLAPHVLAKGSNVANNKLVSMQTQLDEEQQKLLPVTRLTDPEPDKKVGVIRAEPAATVEMALDLKDVGSDEGAPSPHPTPSVKIQLAPSVQDFLNGLKGSDSNPSPEPSPAPAPSSATFKLLEVNF
jgi:hypothetical protein